MNKQIPALMLLVFLLGFFPVSGWSNPAELKEAVDLNDQVGQLVRERRYQQALPLAQKALQIRYKDLGPEHPETAASLTTLGLLYQEMGNPTDALPLLERALQIRNKVLGPSHLATAASLNNLGELYLLLGDYDKALPLLERSLRTRERVLGPEHPDTLETRGALGKLEQSEGREAR
jgi:tetratricopeptide (TPR) repeat protein